ncbi:hypothetical protein EUGRSUZ_B01533 [Eucalyptus grandis]|uniref:Uncharacterized protein n=2 Tax=Eucalyptus grandis TaxID=71139 RepID=A0ACC3LRY9_EUCGR|nr:hypothetical protein EUGRSUZ_B01533 [Eucalyptus grandis]
MNQIKNQEAVSQSFPTISQLLQKSSKVGFCSPSECCGQMERRSCGNSDVQTCPLFALQTAPHQMYSFCILTINNP